PDKKEMQALDRMGVQTVINMRFWETDEGRAKHTDLNTLHIPVNTRKISYEDISKVLKAFRDAEKPVLIHCAHGADRTGAVIAAYRMVYHDWPKEKAIEEMKMEQFGFHEMWFRNIPALLDTLNVAKLKHELGVD